MKFALVDNDKIEATKGAKGICPGCGSELIAKCGDIKLHHWAHKGNRNCDLWWENETEWHRQWKNNFLKEWQEVILRDELTGEKHIADIRTSYGVVIEFQHSHIDPQERIKRESFYKNMVWVVDGTRLKNDYKRLLKNKEDNFRKTGNKGIYLVSFTDECFPKAWLKSSVPIVFDFRGTESIKDINDMRNSLFCLYPRKVGQESILITMTHDFFREKTTNGEWVALMNNISQFGQAMQNQLNIRQRQQENMAFERLTRGLRYQSRRRRF
jgi:competence CoiA-like predicted nuclease